MRCLLNKIARSLKNARCSVQTNPRIPSQHLQSPNSTKRTPILRLEGLGMGLGGLVYPLLWIMKDVYHQQHRHWGLRGLRVETLNLTIAKLSRRSAISIFKTNSARLVWPCLRMFRVLAPTDPQFRSLGFGSFGKQGVLTKVITLHSPH